MYDVEADVTTYVRNSHTFVNILKRCYSTGILSKIFNKHKTIHFSVLSNTEKY